MVRRTHRKKMGRHTRKHRGGTSTNDIMSDNGTSSSSMTPSHEGGRRRRRRRSMRGGDGAADWVHANFGNGQQQWDNTFGPNSITQQGNLLPTVPGAPAVVPGTFPQGVIGNSANVSAAQSGGRRRKRKGGFWGNVVSQALVPFGLLFAQNRFSRRHRKH